MTLTSSCTLAGYGAARQVIALWSVEEQSSQNGDQPSKRKGIVIIEDNPGDVFIMEEALREHNVDCELTVLSDGEQAATYFDSLENAMACDCPQVVLLDLNLPKLSGHSVLSHIRSSHRCASVPVVVVSSSDAPSDLEQNKSLGATAYFKKPNDLNEFMKLGALVNSLLHEL